MKKNLEHKSYHISIVIAVVYGRFCGRLRSFAVVCGRFCGHLRSFAVVCGRFCGHLRSFAVVCGRLRSFAVVNSAIFGRYLGITHVTDM